MPSAESIGLASIKLLFSIGLMKITLSGVILGEGVGVANIKLNIGKSMSSFPEGLTDFIGDCMGG
jgi:hypothetical protein